MKFIPAFIKRFFSYIFNSYVVVITPFGMEMMPYREVKGFIESLGGEYIPNWWY